MSVQTTYTDFPSNAYAGLLCGEVHEIYPMKNVEVSAQIPFGAAVAFATAPTTDQDCQLPLAANTPIIAGIVALADNYDRQWTLGGGGTAGEIGATGVLPGSMLDVLRKGVIWATCVAGCTPGARLFIQKTANGATRPLGALDSATDGSNSIDASTQGVWLTTAAALGLAKLEVDFVSKP